MNHVISVTADAVSRTRVYCSCGELQEVRTGFDLEELIELADEHIRAAERARIFSWT